MKKLPEICKVLGERLRSLRKEAGLTQEELAERAELSFKYYAEVERGLRNPSLRSMEKIANALGVGMDDLFRFKSSHKLTEDEERIIAIVTRVLAEGSKKQKRQVANILHDIMD